MVKSSDIPVKLRVGDLLIKEGLLSEDQLEQALTLQKKQKTYKPLGEICTELKFISKLQLRRILSKHRKMIRIGDLLINLGLITEAQLKEALIQQKQKKIGSKIGEVLIDLGFITEEILINTLSIQLGVPKVIPDPNLIDRSLMEGISEDFLTRNEVLPAFKEDNILTVIMSNPLDDETIRSLEKIFRCTVEPAIAPKAQILNVLSEHTQKITLGVKSQVEETGKDLVIGDIVVNKDGDDNIITILDYIITTAIVEGASDIHIEPREKSLHVRYRVDGILRHKTDLPISLAPNLCSRIKALCGLDIAEKRRHQDGRIEARIKEKEVDLRVSVFASVYGENIVIRILHRTSEFIEIDALGLSPTNHYKLKQILDQPAGIILATGPTGSGKTTTLYASLNYLNDGKRSIITVEDPVEYTIGGVIQGQLETKLGQTYVDFLKSMMRQDPDVIMVGEIRDTEAAEAVIQAALTGHKVLSTFHTDDTTGALLRLMDMGIDTFLISSTVVSVVAQRLVRVLCADCRKPHTPDTYQLASFGIRNVNLDKFTFYQPHGCSLCGGTGFKGRTAIHELLGVNDAIRDAILNRKTSTQIRLIARNKAHLISMREDGFFKATQGITSLEEIQRVIFYNESDEMDLRNPEEIISLCHSVPETAALPVNAESGSKEPLKLDLPYDQDKALKPSLDPVELFRIRFDVTTIEAEADRLETFFKAYQTAMKKTATPVAPDLLNDFIELIIYTVKRVEISTQADFVEFIIRRDGSEVKIDIETLIPQPLVKPAAAVSRENRLRQVSVLADSSGFERALTTESVYHGKIGLRGKPSLLQILNKHTQIQSDDHFFKNQSPPARKSSMYKRYAERLNWCAQGME